MHQLLSVLGILNGQLDTMSLETITTRSGRVLNKTGAQLHAHQPGNS